MPDIAVKWRARGGTVCSSALHPSEIVLSGIQKIFLTSPEQFYLRVLDAKLWSAGVDLVSMDIGGNAATRPELSSADVSDVPAPEADQPTFDTITPGRTASELEPSPEVLRVRGSTSRMHARHASQAARAVAAAGPPMPQEDSELDSTQSIAVSSVISALHKLEEYMRVDSATADAPQKNVGAAVAAKKQTPAGMHAQSLALGCSPSFGSTCSGPLGWNRDPTGAAAAAAKAAAVRGVKGPWRGARDVTESYIMHTLHARSEGPAVDWGEGRIPRPNPQGVRELDSEGPEPSRQASCCSIHDKDIDEIDEISTQLSGRSGSWLCLPGPPPVAHGGQVFAQPPQMHRRSSGVTGSMHISVSTNLGGDTTLDRAATSSCGVASSWLVAFGGNACPPREGGVGGAMHACMGRTSSVASHSEVAV